MDRDPDPDQELNRRMRAFLVPPASHRPLFGLPSAITRNVLPEYQHQLQRQRSHPQQQQQQQQQQGQAFDVHAENKLRNRGIPLQWGGQALAYAPAPGTRNLYLPEFTANTSSTNVGDERFEYL
jgi:hypothetical protein